MKVRINEIQKLLESKLQIVGFTTKETKIIASEYVNGEIKGIHSHGIFGFIRAYEIMKKRKGKKNEKLEAYGYTKRNRYKIKQNKPAFAYIDGNCDMGQIVADYAINLAINKARKSGIAMVGGGNIQAYLRPGTWAEVAAKKDMIGLCFNYGGSPLMAPTGAREPIISTNPIGLGIPFKPFPIVIDMATSVRAFYHIKMAKVLGEKINKEWAIDNQGNPTTDPGKVAAVLPFGGYKGYALSLALEILTGPLVNTKVGKRTKKVRGFLFIVINPYLFTSKKEFGLDVKRLVKEIKTAKKIKGVKNIFIPGEHSYEHERKNRRQGYMNIDEEIMRSIKSL